MPFTRGASTRALRGAHSVGACPGERSGVPAGGPSGLRGQGENLLHFGRSFHSLEGRRGLGAPHRSTLIAQLTNTQRCGWQRGQGHTSAWPYQAHAQGGGDRGGVSARELMGDWGPRDGPWAGRLARQDGASQPAGLSAPSRDVETPAVLCSFPRPEGAPPPLSLRVAGVGGGAPWGPLQGPASLCTVHINGVCPPFLSVGPHLGGSAGSRPAGPSCVRSESKGW